MQEAFALTSPQGTSDQSAFKSNEAEAKPADDKYSFEKLKGKVSRISKSWKDEKSLSDERRELRYLNVNCEEERRTGRFKPHEIYIPIRIIDDNIRKEAPQYISYLTSSRNAAIFKPRDTRNFPQGLSIQELENGFTRMVRYNGWEIPFFKGLDGTQLHGWSAVEVVFDSDKPGHFAIEDIAHENLWFSIDLENSQKAPFLVRNCKVTKEELLKFKDVDKDEVEQLFKDMDKEEGNLYATQEVQKTFYRNEEDGLIYVCWLKYDTGKAFIRAPKPLWLGKMFIVNDSLTGQAVMGLSGKPTMAKIYETQYPIEIHPYIISENGRITSVKGRAFFDEYVQEASSSLVSSIVNAWHLASQVMASPSNPVSGGGVEETDVIIRTGKIYSEPLDFFHMPYPDSGGMNIVEGLITRNQVETTNVNFAVNNREDSRKTAKEIQAAQSQASLLSGVQVVLYSIFLRNVFTRCWAIAKSQLEQGLIADVYIPPEYMAFEYDLYAAGDTEVLQRDEQLAKLQQAWPVFSTTPAAPIILRAIVDLAFPMLAEEINRALMSANPAAIMSSLVTVIQGFLTQYSGAIQPEDQQKLQMILQQASQYIQQQSPQPPNGNSISTPANQQKQLPESTSSPANAGTNPTG